MTAAPACSEARVVALGARRYHVDVAPFSGADLSRAFVSDVASHPTLGVALIMRGNPVVRWFDTDGQARGIWQYDATTHGHSACFDPKGRLYLVDSDRHCVHRFETDGALDITLGIADEPRWREPFNHPTGVAVASRWRRAERYWFPMVMAIRTSIDSRRTDATFVVGEVLGASAGVSAIPTRSPSMRRIRRGSWIVRIIVCNALRPTASGVATSADSICRRRSLLVTTASSM